MEKKNTKLKQAFEQIEKNELNNLPDEQQIVRVYSDSFNGRMDKLLKGTDEDAGRPARHRRIKWSVLVAAVMMIVTFTFTASGFLKGDGMWKLLDFTSDPERYVNVDIEADGERFEGEGQDEHYELTYSGEPVVINYKIDEGETSEEAERGIIIFLNGVRQKFNVKSADGKVKKNVDMYVVGGNPGENEELELSFVPCLGKKGETMALSVSCVFDPDDNHKTKCISKKGTFDWHFDYDNDRICDECSVNIDEIPRSTNAYIMHNEKFVHLVMKKDAPEQKNICTNKELMKESEVHKKIYMMYDTSNDGETVYNEFAAMESMNAVLYKDINKTIRRDFGFGAIVHTDFTTRGKENEKFTLNVHGKPGDYRVSFYIGTDPQPVFDGADRA